MPKTMNVKTINGLVDQLPKSVQDLLDPVWLVADKGWFVKGYFFPYAWGHYLPHLSPKHKRAFLMGKQARE